MKKITLLLTTIFLISACSQNDQDFEADPASFVEYVWHSAGPEFTAENLAMLVNKWNSIIDGINCSAMTGANILTPKAANDGYDLFGYCCGILKMVEISVGLTGLKINKQHGT